MSASERPCGAVPDDDASPAGRVPLPAWELKRFCPPTPASAAVVLPRAAGCSRDMTGRYGQWQQRGVVRRLLRPGCRAVGRVRTPRAGWNGLRGRGVCGARSRREVSLPLAVGRRKLPASARIAHHSDTRARRAPASRHPTQTPIRGSKRECVRKPPLRFCIVSSHRFRKRDPRKTMLFLFRGHTGGFNGSATKSRDWYERKIARV